MPTMRPRSRTRPLKPQPKPWWPAVRAREGAYRLALPEDPMLWASYLAAIELVDEDLADLLRREMEQVAA